MWGFNQGEAVDGGEQALREGELFEVGKVDGSEGLEDGEVVLVFQIYTKKYIIARLHQAHHQQRLLYLSRAPLIGLLIKKSPLLLFHQQFHPLHQRILHMSSIKLLFKNHLFIL